MMKVLKAWINCSEDERAIMKNHLWKALKLIIDKFPNDLQILFWIDLNDIWKAACAEYPEQS